MDFINKILGRNHDDLDLDSGDPFGKESGLNLPDMNNTGETPLGQINNPLSTNNPAGQEPTGLPTSQNNMNFNDPDLNAQTNTPKPDPYKTEINNQPSITPQQLAPAASTAPDNKDIQIIIAKLDAIKSELDSLQQRVQKIEKIAEADQAAATQSQSAPNYGRW